MKRLSLISISILISFLLSGFFVVPAKAYASDVITLINIELEKNEFFLNEEVNLTLVLNDPLKNNWSPVSGLTGSYFQTQIVYCKTENWNGSTCPRGSKTLSTISEISNRNLNEIKFSGADQFELGEYILWRVVLYEVNSFEDPHDYRRNLSNVFVSGIFRDDILVPDFSLGDFSVVEQVAIPEPEPVAEPAPEPEPTPDPVPAPVQQSVVNNPAPRANTSSPSLVAPQVIQSNFYLPAIAGDINWKPMKQIKGKFDGWKRLKKNALNGGKNQVTKTNGSMITFRSEGAALSLRFLGGKKRGSLSIYVNGELLDRVDAKRKKKRALIKTWEGLGEGNHFIDIVAELMPGQSLAINGVHSPRS